ncbi:hypothetical protein [Streptomyces sp. NPDC001530]|uniref:hypothetical protein n=1 Tax=Streptomyces sp. NPDC001530 TaxID=3364582 RepID=UPI0036AC2F5B
MTIWEHGYEATSIALLPQPLTRGQPVCGVRRQAGPVPRGARFLGRRLTAYGAFTARAPAQEPSARAAPERLLPEAAAACTRPGRAAAS